MSTSDKAREKYEPIRAYLGMKYELVGAKLIPESDETTDISEYDKPGGRKWYCQMVREAGTGKHVAATLEDFACANAELALSLRKPKYVNIPTMIKETTRAVIIGPIEGADVILFIINPKQAMHLALLLGGLSAEFKGDVAVCGEATAQVIVEGMPNMTMLCNGARMYGGYTDSDAVVGVPPFMMDKILEKVMEKQSCGGALCGCLITDLPPEVVQNFKSIGFEKNSDFFMGTVSGRSVRVYINKDERGGLAQLTMLLPIKVKEGAEPTVMPPFVTKNRDSWMDIYATLDVASAGLDLHSGGDVILSIMKTMIDAYIKFGGE